MIQLFIKKNKEIFFILFLNLIFFSPILFGGKVMLEGNLLKEYYPWKGEESSLLSKPHNMLCSDGVFYFFPFYQYAAESVKAGILPLWDVYVGGGTNFLGNVTFPFFYPGTFLFYLLRFQDAWDWTFFLHFLLAGLGMYAFLRTLNLNRYSSLIGSIVYNFGGFAFTFVWLNEHIYPFSWTPWIFFFWEKYRQKKLKIYYLLTALLFSIQFSIGQHVFSFYLCLLFLLYFIYFLFPVKFNKDLIWDFLKRTLELGGLFLLAGLLSAAPLFVHHEIVSQSVRGQSAWSMLGLEGYLKTFLGSLTFQKLDGATPWYFLIAYFLPNFFGNYIDFSYWGDIQFPFCNDYTSVGSHYLGIFPCLLLICVFLKLFKNKTSGFFAGASLCLLLANFQWPSPLYLLPGSELLFKYHNRLVFLMAFTFAACAAYAVQWVIAEHKDVYLLRPIFGKVLQGAGLFLLSLCLLGGGVLLSGPVVLGKLKSIVETLFGRFTLGGGFFRALQWEFVYFAWFSFVFCGTVYLLSAWFQKKISPKKFKSFALILIVADLFLIGMRFYPRCDPASVYPQTSSIRYLQNNLGNHRMIDYGKFGKDPEVFRPNIPHIYGIQDAGYFLAFPAESYRNLLSLVPAELGGNLKNYKDIHARTFVHGVNFLSQPHDLDSKLLDLLGIKYLVAAEDVFYTDKTYDFLEHLTSASVVAPNSRYVQPDTAALKGDVRKVIFQHSDSTLTYDLLVPENSRFFFGVGMMPASWRDPQPGEDGVRLKLVLVSDRSGTRELFSKTLDAKKNLEDRNWFDQEIDLREFGGEKVRMIFSVEPLEDTRNDFAVWSRPVILQGPKQRPWPLVWDQGMKVFENVDVMPRAFTVNRAQTFPDQNALNAAMIDPSFDPKKGVYFLKGQCPEALPSFLKEDYFFEPVVIEKYEANEVVLKSHGKGDGVLVLTDNHFPGWRAWIDDGEIPIYPAFGNFRSVFIPGGEQRIVFKYSPVSLSRGLLISSFSLCLLIIVGIGLAVMNKKGRGRG